MQVVAEVVQVIGDKVPTLSHKEHMPLTSAVMQEVFRHRPLIPIVRHRATDNVTVNGYIIPKVCTVFINLVVIEEYLRNCGHISYYFIKNTEVHANIWAVHHDSRLWKNPDVFDPYRHISPEGKFVRSKYIIPFSLGNVVDRDNIYDCSFVPNLRQFYLQAFDNALGCRFQKWNTSSF